MPGGFEAYARILHPASATRYGPAPGATVPAEGLEVVESARWRWAQVAARTGGVVHPQVQWTRLAGHTEPTLHLGGGWEVDPPPYGHLEPDLLAALMAVAGQASTAPDDLLVAVWEGWAELHPASTAAMVWVGATDQERQAVRERVRAARAAAVDPQVARALGAGPLLEVAHRRYVLLTATAQELMDPSWPVRAGIGWQDGFPGPMPQLIWPADRTWCVASEVELDFTVVSGSHRLVQAILTDPALEAVAVQADDDLTWDGDDLNRPSCPS